jgi:hypothetical protein
MGTDSRLVQCGSGQMLLFSVTARRAGMNPLLCCSFYELVSFFGSNNAKFLFDVSEPTQSIGLLSYTFLVETGQKDVVVPVVCCTKCSLFFGARHRACHFNLSLMIFLSPQVDYKCNLFTGHTKRLERHGSDHFSSNLSVLLKWSPFATEEELMHNVC